MESKAEKRFKQELQIWLKEDQSVARRFEAYARNKLNFMRRMRFRWLALPHILTVTALTASGPTIAFQTSGALSIKEAIAYFFCLLGVLIFFQSINAWSKAKAVRISGPLQTIWVRIGDLLHTVKSNATAVAARDHSIETTLAIAASIAAEIAQVKSQDVAASLVQYSGTGFGQMKVTHRNRGSLRPFPRRVKQIETLLGHHACQQDMAPRVVADIRKFGPLGLTSPTHTKHTYRSLLIQPVVSSKSEKLRGFISVDCTVSHAFHGHRADDLVALLEPIKAHIEDMI